MSLPSSIAGFPRSGFPTPNSPAPQTITHTHHTAPNSTAEHCTTTSQHPTTILPLYILHSLTHFLTTPSSCSSNPPPPNPPKPSFHTATNKQQRCRKQRHRASQASYGCWQACAGLPVAGAVWSGPQRPPLVAPRGQKWHESLTCNRQGERYKLV